AEDPNSAALQRSIIDSADCLIELKRIEFRGSYHVMLQIVKTRKMRHRKEAFELVIGPQRVDVNTNPSLLRITPDGKVSPLRIRLFLHDRSEAQQRHNHQLVSAIQSIVSPDVKIDKDAQDSGALVKAWALGTASALDELQVVQIDEFQMPDAKHENSAFSPLHIYDQDHWFPEWDDFLPRFKKRIQTKRGQFSAIPFYVNIALLAMRSLGNQINKSAEGVSWEEISERCAQWDTEYKDSDQIYFDFNTGNDENYSCLFLEILLSRQWRRPSASQPLEEWLSQPDATEAAKIFRNLCKRTHLRKLNSGSLTAGVDPNAQVWRLWYSELNELTAKAGSELRGKLSTF